MDKDSLPQVNGVPLGQSGAMPGQPVDMPGQSDYMAGQLNVTAMPLMNGATNGAASQPMGQMMPNAQMAQFGQAMDAGQAGAAVQPIQPAGLAPQSSMAATAVPEDIGPERGSGLAGLLKTIAIVILALISATFIGLFIWMTIQYNEASTDVNGQIKTAVDAAVDDNTMALELEFAEREKDPYREFTGPADYGELSFKYPKTWSLYVAADAANGGNYQAYFNPIEVSAVSATNINALRLIIFDIAFDNVVADYQKFLEQRDSQLSMQSVVVAGVSANRYTGTIPNTQLSGIIVIFRIRDKTVLLQTDSLFFEADFNRLLDTIKFNA